MRINLTAHRPLDRQELLDAFVTAQLSLLACQPPDARADPAYAEIDGVDPAHPPDDEGAVAYVAALVVDLVEPAKSTALDKLDEGRQAFRIATAWLRSKPGVVEPGPATNAPGKGPETPTL